MKGDPLPEQDHILRYVGGKNVQGDVFNGGGFIEAHPDRPSVNWLEFFEQPIANQVAEVRKRSRLTYRSTARLARLNVGHVKAHVAANFPDGQIDCMHEPLDETEKYPADESHSEIHGVPDCNSPEGELVGDLIAQCVIDHFPAKDT